MNTLKTSELYTLKTVYIMVYELHFFLLIYFLFFSFFLIFIIFFLFDVLNAQLSASSPCTLVYSHHHPLLQSFSLPKWKLHLLNTKLPIPLFHPLATSVLLSVFEFDHSRNLL